MKTHLKQIMLMLALVLTVASCSSDDNDNTPINKSRDVKYEVTGNYTGTLGATYIESGDAGQSVDITSFPWTKEFTASTDTSGASITVSGYGGVKDQTVTIKIIIGGKIEKETTAKATADGIIVGSPGPYVFPQ
jgi:hypothetical protein